MASRKIVLCGGAGLVGQNLLNRLVDAGYANLVVIDKHKANLQILRSLHPQVIAIDADLAEPGDWVASLEGAAAVVMLQAQIGGIDYQEFLRNNVESTQSVLDAMKRFKVPYLVHISSSVVESVVDDFYTDTKQQQEDLVLASGIPCVVLRPTLMFGWFDRKHLGWLSRFMRKVPVFPIPGHGRYMRQPLYVGDFSRIIMSCIDKQTASGVHNISGHEKLNYVDIIRHVRRATKARTLIVHIPYRMFQFLLWVWAIFDRNPPFTTQQLAALVAKDEFEVIDWPNMFGVQATPFAQAIDETFNDPRYGHIALEF